MRSAIKVSFLLVLGMTLGSVIGAQEKKVTKPDIERLESAADTKLKSLSYRVKTTKLGFFDDRKPPYHKSTMISEYLRPDRERMFYEVTDKKGTKRSESVEIGDNEYSREGDGPWKVTRKATPDLAKLLIPLGKADQSDESVKYEYLYLGKKELNGMMADLYQVTTTRSLRSASGDIINPSVKKYWFDKNGRLLRTQIDTTDNVTRALHQEIKEYEYDVVIKIEAPIK